MKLLKKKMLWIILGNFLAILLNWGISEDKAADEQATPIGDILQSTMEAINANYKDNIDADIANLKDFGHISRMNGDFSFFLKINTSNF